MHVVVAAAIAGEIQGLVASTLGSKLENFGRVQGIWRRNKLTFLATGIGMANAAFSLGQFLAEEECHFLLQLGIAGTFAPYLPMGSVVEVGSETFSELGAASPDGFLDLKSLGFPLWTDQQGDYFNKLDNPHPPLLEGVRVPGITVQKAHGIDSEIVATLLRWQPRVESMEGAATFLAGLRCGVPFAEIRSISNRVEARDRDAWNIPLAVQNLHEVGLKALEIIFQNYSQL